MTKSEHLKAKDAPRNLFYSLGGILSVENRESS